MLADAEWKTPHAHPAGGTVAEWVETVRWFEANGWLRDPMTLPALADDHPARPYLDSRAKLCPSLCWRRRCRRAGRCRHVMPLAIREFMPELAVHLNRLAGQPMDYSGPLDPAKMTVLAELFPALAEDEP